MTTALVDGDMFAYRIACGEEKSHDFGDGRVILTADADTGKENLDAFVESIRERLDADRIVIALSDAENFRKEVMPSYKSNRADVRRPLILEHLKEHLAENYECFVRPTLEADDVLGILLTNPKIVTGRKVVVTWDKDLRSVPGLHFNPSNDTKPVPVSEAEADVNFYSQVLSGDAVDGYAGCPGIGKVRALEHVTSGRKVVRQEQTIQRGKNAGKTRTLWVSEPCDDVWEIIVALYEKSGQTEEDALRAARVARILRHEDYDYKNKRPILWTPS